MRSARVDGHGSGTLTNALSPPTQFGTATQHSETHRLAVGWNPIDTFLIVVGGPVASPYSPVGFQRCQLAPSCPSHAQTPHRWHRIF